MTIDEFKAIVHSWGCTPCRPSFQGSTIHETRDGLRIQIEDPEDYSPDERAAIISLLKERLGITEH